MFHLAVIATAFSCIDAQILIDKMSEYKIEEETRAEMISVVVEETPHCEWDAKADWRNGSNPPYLEVKPMAQVTYRGVKYDTDKRNSSAPSKSELIYRGVKHNSKLAAV